ncbi:5'-methylthioribose kinase [Halanaerobium saccharolyticum]|uniref:S-methyl-5-thioribose kinase n=1 Tax=Halanaerobium saccharolyticum TaxID=43595 RepID=A0A4R6LNQ2_9FIRM|nr:S-methyl-5-thioribose kinase [Halanaerobium saccharolyticum]TDO84339.1 5'-methylthioribose kinase [Halanaerobium saccharolyticum]
MVEYKILDSNSVKDYILEIMPDYCAERDDLKVEEVGDGNLNLVFKVNNSKDSAKKTLILKQALPYVRLVGKDWPMTRDRSRIESEAIKVQANYCPDYVPKIFFTDNEMSVFIMEDLSDYNLYAYNLMQGEKNDYIAEIVGEFLAENFFHSSDLGMDAKEKKNEVKKFINPDLCKITEDLIFTEPYFDVERNNVSESLRPFLEEDFWLRDELKTEVAKLKYNFMNHAEALLHGDMHTRSIFVKDDSVKIFDQEFAFYGPMGFDFGLFFGNLLLNFVTQEYWNKDKAVEMQDHIIEVINDTWHKFEERFLELMDQSEDRMYSLESMKDIFIKHLLAEIAGYTGTSAIRRVHGLAGVPEFWDIEDEKTRADLKIKALNLGSELIVKRKNFESIDDLLDVVRKYKI